MNKQTTKLLNRIKYECNSIAGITLYKQYTVLDMLVLLGILIILTLFFYVALVTGIKI